MKLAARTAWQLEVDPTGLDIWKQGLLGSDLSKIQGDLWRQMTISLPSKLLGEEKSRRIEEIIEPHSHPARVYFKRNSRGRIATIPRDGDHLNKFTPQEKADRANSY